MKLNYTKELIEQTYLPQRKAIQISKIAFDLKEDWLIFHAEVESLRKKLDNYTKSHYDLYDRYCKVKAENEKLVKLSEIKRRLCG